jgi:hypothetical protein
MCPMIANSTSCKICAVIWILRAENMNAVEIHRVLYAVYSQIIMSEGAVRECCGMLKISEQIFRMNSVGCCCCYKHGHTHTGELSISDAHQLKLLQRLGWVSSGGDVVSSLWQAGNRWP